MEVRQVSMSVNGRERTVSVEDRKLLLDTLREELELTSVHAGCEHGVCGACTILIDGKAVRSCLMLTVQADGRDVRTVEGLAANDGTLHPIQQAFLEEHGLQCGFCTPGFLMSVHELLESNPDPTDDEIRDTLGGNICRCTGYQAIFDAVRSAAGKMKAAQASG